MDILHIAAFSDGVKGGNPAGVVIGDSLPLAEQMQVVAHDVGFSETAFAAPKTNGWRVRYFSPESEVPFCGHATIALGAALAMQHGDGVFDLELNDANITVEGTRDEQGISAALQSPPTRSKVAGAKLVEEALALFAYRSGDLDTRIAPAVAEAGSTHLVLALKNRDALANMSYEFERGRAFMKANGLVTVNLIYTETSRRFHARNAFAAGGVYEDPATGAAAAALAGYLRDIGWPADDSIEIIQGEDMGSRSVLKAEFTKNPGESVRVSGAVRMMEHLSMAN